MAKKRKYQNKKLVKIKTGIFTQINEYSIYNLMILACKYNIICKSTNTLQ